MIENITETSEEFWRVSILAVFRFSEASVLQFQDHGGYPDLDMLGELSEENPTYLLNSESKTKSHKPPPTLHFSQHWCSPELQW